MINALKKLNEMFDKKTRRQFILLFMLLVIKSFLDGFGLGLIVPFIAALGDPSLILDSQVFQRINIYTKITSGQSLIYWMSAILVVFFIIKNLLSIFVTYFQNLLVFTKRSHQGRALFVGYMSAPFSYHLEHNSAEFDRNIRFESANVYTFVQTFILLCSNVFLAISIAILLLLANWQVVVGVGLFTLIFAYIFLSISGKYNNMFGKIIQESQLYAGQALKEGLSSITESKLYQIETFFPDRFLKHMMSNARANWRQASLASAPYPFFETLAVGIMAVVVMVLSIRNIDIYSLLPMLALFSIAFIRLIPAITAIINGLQNIKFLIPAVDVVHADFQRFSCLMEQASIGKEPLQQQIDFDSLTLKDVTFAFPSNKTLKILDGVNINIQRGQAIGITGPSGAGKTTLINILLGLLKPEQGEVYVNGKDMNSSLADWYALIGYVPQVITLIDASIKENVALGFEGDEINSDKVWSALKEANLDAFVRDLPEGPDTLIGENGVRLSGGQRQRLGLARALYRDPEVLVFDEATSSLDMNTEKKITREIMKLTGKRTLIIIAHRISTIKDCDVIYYMKDGKVINSGSYQELAKINQDFKTLIDQTGSSNG